MSVSSPSYFPPAGSAGQVVGSTAGRGATGVRTFLAGANAGKFTQPVDDLIVIGDGAYSGGTAGAPNTDNARLAGTVVIGSGAAANVLTTQSAGYQRGPSTVIGFNAVAAAADLTSCTIIGSNALAQYTSAQAGQYIGNLVAIGESVGANLVPANFGAGTGPVASVFIGNQAVKATNSANGAASLTNNVVIGHQAVSNISHALGTGGSVLKESVIIGFRAGYSVGNDNNAAGGGYLVFVGSQSGDDGHPQASVYVGFGMTSGVSSGLANVGIGSSAGGTCLTGTKGNVVIGSEALNVATNNRCVMIGYGVGDKTGAPIAGADDQFLLETVDNPPGGTRRTLLYGLFGAASPGGIIVGHSTPGTNRDLPGFNLLKLMDGSVTGVAPVGGGFFYSVAGRLHWVDTGNVDWALSGTVAGQLASSVVAYTNNAAAAAGTLTNAPAAGNPTKWIPVNDNGTIRNVPAW